MPSFAICRRLNISRWFTLSNRTPKEVPIDEKNKEKEKTKKEKELPQMEIMVANSLNPTVAQSESKEYKRYVVHVYFDSPTLY